MSDNYEPTINTEPKDITPEEVDVEISRKANAPDVNDFNVTYTNKVANNSEIINRNRAFVTNLPKQKEEESPSYVGDSDGLIDVVDQNGDLFLQGLTIGQVKEVLSKTVNEGSLKLRFVTSNGTVVEGTVEEFLIYADRLKDISTAKYTAKVDENLKNRPENQEEVPVEEYYSKETKNNPENQEELDSLSSLRDDPRKYASFKQKYRDRVFSQEALTQQEIENQSGVSGVNFERAENRIRDIGSELKIFLYNALPYTTVGLVNDIVGQVQRFGNTDYSNSGDVVGLTAGTISAGISALNSLNNLKYFTPAELGLLMGANFYILNFAKASVKVKKVGSGNTGVSSNRDVWDGEPDIFFGKGAGEGIFSRFINSVRSRIQNRFFNTYPSGISDNQAIADLKDGSNALTAKIVFPGYGNANTELIPDPKELIFQNPDSKQEQQQRNTVNSQVKFVERDGNKWVSGRNGNDRDTVSYATAETKWFYNSSNFVSNLLRDEKRLSSLLTEWNNNRVETNNANDENYLQNKKDYTDLYKQIREDSNPKLEEWDSDENNPNRSDRNYLELKKDYPSDLFSSLQEESNPELLKISLSTDTKNQENENKTKVELQAAIKEKGILGGGQNWQLGAIYVIPVVSDEFSENLPRFYIPFEFNPSIEEGGVEARYQATQILSRINDLQSYISTSNMTVNISTNYFATSHNGSNATDSQGFQWMSEFTMENLQAIEMAYRSLVYPHFPEDSEQIEGAGYRYVKPPLIKVIMGSEEELNGIYNGLLSYQSEDAVNGRLSSAQRFPYNRLRTFIATNVQIQKNIMETPLYIDRNINSYQLKDTMGFSVSLSLTEVAPSYTDASPDYLSYSKRYTSLSSDFTGVG